MAYAQTLTNAPQPMHRTFGDPQPSTSGSTRPQASKQKFVSELSQCLFDFVLQLLPTQEEMALKEDVRKLLERLIRTIEPESRLLSFGSTANGFSLRNSDMDLCCLIDSEERLSASDLVTMLGDLLERETKFHVKPLPHARIPIVKLSLDPSPGLPLGIACDIGFENRLALENTRLLMCYAMIDPTRVRTMVLFLKVWSKRRKINSPYKGTLSSYGYVLLVIYFLVHVKNPPVLPNLQKMPPLRPISKEDTHLNGHNIWFFDDIDLLRRRWRSENSETVADLLIDFFRHYARDFSYTTGVASIREGFLKKEVKGWQNGPPGSRFGDARERNKLCLEDPFETDFNVGRCVTRDGLYTIRGEFMRASRILAQRPERALLALAELCEDRKGEELVSAPPYHSKPPTLPPQTPYTVGSQTIRPTMEERFSPPAQFFEPGQRQQPVQQPVVIRPPPEHMAPKRGKWTSPPPPEAPSADHTLFENQFGMSLQLATSSTGAREKDSASESNSEVFTDEGSETPDDDTKSVKSFTEGSSSHPGPLRRPTWHTLEAARPPSIVTSVTPVPSSSSASGRGRYFRPAEKTTNTVYRSPADFGVPSFQPPLNEPARRSSSGPPPRTFKHPSFQSNTSGLALVTSLPPSPAATTSSSPVVDHARLAFPSIDPANVYYRTSPTNVARAPPQHIPSPTVYPHSLSPSTSALGSQHPRPQSQYQFTHSPQAQTPMQTQFQPSQRPSSSSSSSQNANMQSKSPPSAREGDNVSTIQAPVPRDILPSNLSTLNYRSAGSTPRTLSFGSSDTPTPATYHRRGQQSLQRDEESRNPESSSSSSSSSSPLRRAHAHSSLVVVVTEETKGSLVLPLAVESAGTVSSHDKGNLVSISASDIASAHTLSPTERSVLPDALFTSLSITSRPRSSGASTRARIHSPTTRNSCGGYSSGISRSPSLTPPPVAGLLLPVQVVVDEAAENLKEMERSSERLGIFGLEASDSVSTIKPDDGAGEEEVVVVEEEEEESVSQSKGNGCALMEKVFA